MLSKAGKKKMLSKVGKEVVIKSIAQATPTYVMSIFKLPITLCQDMERMLYAYWWGHGMEKGKELSGHPGTAYVE